MLFQCHGVGGNRTRTVHTGYCGIGENGVGKQFSSRILEMKGRLEIGLKMEGLVPFLFKIGLMAAVLKDVGIVPVLREE